MSRGFDGFEIDDFRGPGSDSERDVGRGASSERNTREKPQPDSRSTHTRRTLPASVVSCTNVNRQRRFCLCENAR